MDDVTPGGMLYLWARPSSSQITCIRAPCPTYVIEDVNLSRQQLAYTIDWRALDLPTDQQAKLAPEAGKLLLYGRYATGKAFGEPVQIFQVLRANVRVSEQSIDTPDMDRYYTVHAATPSCTQPSCPGLDAILMNRLQAESFSGADLSRLGLSPAAQAQLESELQSGAAYVSVRDASTMPVVLTEAFRPYRAKPLP
jgi:hypothetical protein